MSERTLDPIQDLGWVGMWNNRTTPAPPGHVYLAENYYLNDARWSPMPGSVSLGTLESPVQAVAWFQRLDGARFTVAIANGKLWSYNEEQGTWSQVTTPGGVVIDPGATIDWCVYRTRIIFTDGTNRPWAWDGESDFEVLDLAPIANGCAIYFDRVFFWDIPGFETEFHWSRPGQPALGYNDEDQVWEFAQTDTGRVRSLIPLNDFLVVLKADSGTYVQGFTEENFQTAAVREGISDTEGTESLFGAVIAESEPYYWSTNGPRYLRGGNRRIELEMAGGNVDMLRDTLQEVDLSRLEDVRGFYYRPMQQVVWLLPRKGIDALNWGVVYSRETQSWSTIQLPETWDVTCVASHQKGADGGRWSLLGLADGRVVQYGHEEIRTHDEVGVTARIESQTHGRDTPHDAKRLVEVWVYGSSDDGVNRGRLVAVVDGEEIHPRRLMQINPGRYKRYRRGFNAIGSTVQWRLEFKDPEDVFHLESVELQFTASSRHARP